MSVCRQPRNQHKLYPVQTILLTQGRQGTPRSPSPCGSRQKDQHWPIAGKTPGVTATIPWQGTGCTSNNKQSPTQEVLSGESLV